MRAWLLRMLLPLIAVLGCARVAPYDRGRLAHPTMQLADMDHAAQAHVHAIHEGAAGGDLGASSGCGCN